MPTPDSAPRRLSNTECEKCCSYDVMFVRHDAEGVAAAAPSVVREGWASLWGITAEHIHWGSCRDHRITVVFSSPYDGARFPSAGHLRW